MELALQILSCHYQLVTLSYALLHSLCVCVCASRAHVCFYCVGSWYLVIVILVFRMIWSEVAIFRRLSSVYYCWFKSYFLSTNLCLLNSFNLHEALSTLLWLWFSGESLDWFVHDFQDFYLWTLRSLIYINYFVIVDTCHYYLFEILSPS